MPCVLVFGNTNRFRPGPIWCRVVISFVQGHLACTFTDWQCSRSYFLPRVSREASTAVYGCLPFWPTAAPCRCSRASRVETRRRARSAELSAAAGPRRSSRLACSHLTCLRLTCSHLTCARISPVLASCLLVPHLIAPRMLAPRLITPRLIKPRLIVRCGGASVAPVRAAAVRAAAA